MQAAADRAVGADDVAEHFGWSQPATAAQHLRRLVRAGLLEHSKYTARTWKVTEAGKRALAPVEIEEDAARILGRWVLEDIAS